jgi:iron complex transport system substrate-binding protein
VSPRHLRPALLIFLLLSLVLLAACSPAAPQSVAVETAPAAEAPTAPPPTTAPTVAAPAAAPTEAPAEAPEASGEPIVTVLEMPYTLADLQAMEQVESTAGDRTATGPGLLALLEAAAGGAALPESVQVVASDGYAASVALAELDDTAVLGLNDDGSLETLIPTLPKKTWVRDVVEIVAEELVEAVEGQGTESIPLDTPLEFVDGAGRTVTLEALPGRIMVVGTGPHMTLHILYMFEEGRARLVGSESRASTPSEFLQLVDDRFSQIPVLAANPNVEQIAALQPDLVIMKGMTESELGETLNQAGIAHMYVNLESTDAFFSDLANIGALLGAEERAQEIADWYQQHLDALDKAVAQAASKPSVLMLSYSARGAEVAVKVPAEPWMQTAEVRRAGGEPVWLDSAAESSGWTVTNLEQIAQWNPDQIYVIINWDLDMQEVMDGLKADPGWAALKAVQNGQLYAFPQDIFGWDQPEPRWILGMQWLGQHIHPDLMADLDMEATVRDWFASMYGMDQAAFDERILPRLRMDID